MKTSGRPIIGSLMFFLILSCQTAGSPDTKKAPPPMERARENQEKTVDSDMPASGLASGSDSATAEESLDRLADKKDEIKSARVNVSDLPVLSPKSSQFTTDQPVAENAPADQPMADQTDFNHISSRQAALVPGEGEYPVHFPEFKVITKSGGAVPAQIQAPNNPEPNTTSNTTSAKKDSDRIAEQDYEPVIKDFSNYITSNDIDPDEPDHYYLRKKKIPDQQEKPEVSVGSSQSAVLKTSEAESKPKSETETDTEKNFGHSTEKEKPVGGKKTAEEEKQISPDYEIKAIEGETIQLSMTELDWIFDRNNSSSEGVIFEETQYLQSSKEFLFTARKAGNYILSFTRSNLDTGATETRRVAVVVSIARDETEVAETTSGKKTGSESSNRKYLGSFSADVLREGLSNRNEEVLGRQLELLANYMRDAPDKATDDESAIQAPPWSEVLDAAEQLENSQYEEAAISALKLFLDHAAGSFDETGRVYYLLGKMYESPTLPRDERTAVDYYKKVLDIFPSDIYYFRAEERIRYLERHFLQIR